MTEVVARNLHAHGVKAMALNGDMTQARREKVIEDFKAGKILALVATDVAARGIHVDAISHVYNYDMPNEAETYTHRVGRTARAGSDGIAISIVSDYDYDVFGRIMQERRGEIKKMEAGDFERLVFKMQGGDSDRGDRRGSFGGRGSREGGSRGGFSRDGPRRDSGRSGGFGGRREGGSGRSGGYSGGRDGGSREGGYGRSREGGRSSERSGGYGDRSGSSGGRNERSDRGGRGDSFGTGGSYHKRR